MTADGAADAEMSPRVVHADEHAGAMHMTMTIVRPGLFFQREGPGSEPGNSLLRPDEASLRYHRIPDP